MNRPYPYTFPLILISINNSTMFRLEFPIFRNSQEELSKVKHICMNWGDTLNFKGKPTPLFSSKAADFVGHNNWEFIKKTKSVHITVSFVYFDVSSHITCCFNIYCTRTNPEVNKAATKIDGLNVSISNCRYDQTIGVLWSLKCIHR